MVPKEACFGGTHRTADLQASGAGPAAQPLEGNGFESRPPFARLFIHCFLIFQLYGQECATVVLEHLGVLKSPTTVPKEACFGGTGGTADF
jgi:hypothetical protein